MGCKILHIDDEASDLETYAGMLHFVGGHDVTSVPSFEEANEQLKKEKFDLEIWDSKLQGSDVYQGVKIASMRRKQGRNVLVFSSFTEAQNLAVEKGVPFLHKLDSDMLLDTVARLTSNK